LTNERFENYDFGYMVQGLFDFWLKELADYYIEAIKPVMKSTDEEAKKAALNTLYICLDSGLRMLHPTMPYLTEELFQRLPHRKGEAPESICIAPFPTNCVSFVDDKVEENVAILQNIVSKFRSQFAALNIAKNANPEVCIRISNGELETILKSETGVIQSLIRSGVTGVIGADG
jgi:valyl-tRNA synthetase